jgi:hypothetical protein
MRQFKNVPGLITIVEFRKQSGLSDFKIRELERTDPSFPKPAMLFGARYYRANAWKIWSKKHIDKKFRELESV